MKRWILFIALAVALVAWCAFIFLMSNTPLDKSSELSSGVIRLVLGFVVPGFDQMPAAEQSHWQEALSLPVRKTAHFLEYAALGALSLALAWHARKMFAAPSAGKAAGAGASGNAGAGAGNSPRPKRLAGACWAFATAYAATDEFHQLFVPDRTGIATDILLDSAGALAGVLIAAAILRAMRDRDGSNPAPR